MADAARSSRTLMRLLAVLVLAFAFALPAFESHVCEAPTEQATASATTDAPADDACPDCGPACANGCCHAPHAATAPETAVALPRPAFAPVAWPDMADRPDLRPDGPERPPRA